MSFSSPSAPLWRQKAIHAHLSAAKRANHNIIDELEREKNKKIKKTPTSRSTIDNLCSPSREKELIWSWWQPASSFKPPFQDQKQQLGLLEEGSGRRDKSSPARRVREGGRWATSRVVITSPFWDWEEEGLSELPWIAIALVPTHLQAGELGLGPVRAAGAATRMITIAFKGPGKGEGEKGGEAERGRRWALIARWWIFSLPFSALH